MDLPGSTALVVAAWVLASYRINLFDRFPLLAITSPEMGCGKTRLLELLYLVTPRAYQLTNVSPAALFRIIEKERPTLLIDEASAIGQSGKSRVSELSALIYDLLNASISKNAKSLRCVVVKKKDYDTKAFSLYCPKVVAKIGAIDSVLADKCLPVQLQRTKRKLRRFISREVDPRGAEIAKAIEDWARENEGAISLVYGYVEPFDIRNDRTAELLIPLQSVLSVLGGIEALEMLEEYAKDLEKKQKEQETQSDGVRLLFALREIFEGQNEEWINTHQLIDYLKEREEEPWGHWSHGKEITPEGLRNLLFPLGVKSQKNRKNSARGYYAADLRASWEIYLPPNPPSNLSKVSTPPKPSTHEKANP